GMLGVQAVFRAPKASHGGSVWGHSQLRAGFCPLVRGARGQGQASLAKPLGIPRGLRPEPILRTTNCPPKPSGGPGPSPAPLLSSWPEWVLGWNCRKDSQEAFHPVLSGWVDTRMSQGGGGGPEGRQERGWNLLGGPCPPPAQAEAAKFGPILSSCPYLVIRLRHKGGCGPLAATRLLQRETMASRKAGTRGKAAATKQAQRGSSNVFSMFEQAQIQEFKEAFSCIDQNRDGVIGKSDLRETYSQLGKVNVPEEELDAMLQEGKGPINFTVFLTLFGEKLNGTDPEEAILSAFRLFDPSGKGVVNRDEFKQLLLTQADKFSLAEVEQMFALTPMDLAGNIDYKSLCYIITHGDEKEE
ncbi:hypothetical protein EI555_008060, partial [Monodon monoceros]